MLTNYTSLPNALVYTLTSSQREYEPQTVHVTGLIQPTQLYVLQLRHGFKVENDVAEMGNLIIGSAVHKSLEGYPDGLVEADWENQCLGYTVVGRTDLVEDGVIYDYKTTKVSHYGYPKSDWEQQLNIYAWLLRHYGIKVKALRVIAFYKDFNPRDLEGKLYQGPQNSIEAVHIPLWPASKAESFVEQRVAALKAALEVPDDQLPACSLEERWGRPGYFGVYSGRTLKSKHENIVTAERAVAQYRNGEVRAVPETNIRCEFYCPVARFCKQVKNA